MPIQTLPLPFSQNDHDPFTLQMNEATDVFGLHSYQNKLTRAPGSLVFGQGTITGIPRNFLQGFEGSSTSTERFILFTSSRLFRYDDGTDTWIVVNAAVGEPDAATPINPGIGGVERYSTAYTLGSIFFSGFGLTDIFFFNGTSVGRFSTQNWTPTGINNLGATVVLPFADRIVAVRTNEDGVDRKTMIRWHIISDVSDWDGDGSGFLDIRETNQAPIISAAVLGDRAYIFKENQIVELIATGSSDQVFRTETRVHGTGMVCRHSWAATDQFGFFVGPDDVYVWDGSNLQAIGEPIRRTLFDRIDFTSTADLVGASKVQGVIYTSRQEYWLLVQAGNTPNLFIYDYRRNRWYTDHYAGGAGSATAIGRVRPGTTLINNPGDIGATDFLISARSAELPYRFVEGEDSRLGVSFTSRLITRDYPAIGYVSGQPQPSLDRMNALWEFTFRTVPNAIVSCSYSTDGGTTYSTAEQVTANADGVVRWFPTTSPVAFNRIRFRIENVETEEFELSQQMAYQWTPIGVNYGANV